MKHLDEAAINLRLYEFLKFFASLESNVYGKSSSLSLVSIPKEVRTDFFVVQYFWCRSKI